ncbi:hypothetical protein [Paraburkholderia youngii]
MLGYLHLPWDEAVLNHAAHEHALFNRPWGHPAAQAASKPLHTGRNGRYLHDLTPGEIAEFERIAGKELIHLGYDLSMPRSGSTR